MNKMDHILSVPGGYLVRKRVLDRLKQRYFSVKRYGSDDTALTAAAAFLEDCLQEIEANRFEDELVEAVDPHLEGAHWYCRRQPLRNGEVVHAIRVSVSHIVRAWSIPRYGLWGAYQAAANHLANHREQDIFSDVQLAERFTGFIDEMLMAEYCLSDQDIKAAIWDSLIDLSARANLPDCIMSHRTLRLIRNASEATTKRLLDEIAPRPLI